MSINKITIVTPTFNSEKYLEQTILSVINQKYINLEYIIIDGASNDGTLDIINKYKKYITTYISEKDNGMYYALKKGFDQGTGEIYGWINSDDILLPGALNAVNKAFNEIDNCQWLTGIPSNLTKDDVVYSKAQSHYKRQYTRDEFLNKKTYAIQQESTFFRSDLYKKVGNISTSYKLAGDYALWTKFFDICNPILINCPIGAFRFHGKQLSADMDQYLEEVVKIRSINNTLDLKRKYQINHLKEIFFKLLPSIVTNRIDKKENLYLLNKKENKFIKSNRWQ